MGWLSSAWKSTKNAFKKVGKIIKKGIAKVGKFMNKIGIVGQIALGLMLPGIGQMLGTWAGTASTNIFSAAAKSFVNGAINLGTKVGSVFKTVTSGVTKVVGQTVGTALNKVGLGDVVKNMGWDITGMNNFTGPNGVFQTAGDEIAKSLSAGRDLFSMDTLTGTNKYALQAQAKAVAAGPNLTGEPNMSRVELPAGPEPQMSGLTDGDTTSLLSQQTPVAASSTVPVSSTPVAIPAPNLADGLQGVDLTQAATDTVAQKVTDPDSLMGKVGELWEETKALPGKTVDQAITEMADFRPLEGLGNKVTEGVASTSLRKMGLATPTPVYEGARSFSSTTVLPDEASSSSIGTDMFAGSNISALAFAEAGGSWGNPAAVYNAEQETAQFKANQRAYTG